MSTKANNVITVPKWLVSDPEREVLRNELAAVEKARRELEEEITATIGYRARVTVSFYDSDNDTRQLFLAALEMGWSKKEAAGFAFARSGDAVGLNDTTVYWKDKNGQDEQK